MSTKNVEEAFAALESHLKEPGKADISTIRNYHFAVLVYSPAKEFEMRSRLQRSMQTLNRRGWSVKTISLLEVVMRRLKNKNLNNIERLISKEKRLYNRGKERGLNDLKRAIQNELDGNDGIAKDVAKIIDQFIDEDPSREGNTVVFLGRIGSLYPFFRSSALLRYLQTSMRYKTPTILLYPGKQQGDAGLSFMEKLNPDRDYRPRIY